MIQEADLRALEAGTTTDHIFDMVRSIKDKLHVPVVFMTYINPIYVYGTEKFARRAKECGAAGVIVPDVPFEEKEEFLPVCRKYGVDLISMIAPTSEIFHEQDLEVVSMIAPTSSERVKMIAAEAEGFVYCVSSLGVTGMRSEISTDIASLIRDVKSVKEIPCAIGFGISTPEQAKKMAAVSDGAIVGSAIVKIVAEHGKKAPSHVKKYVQSMKSAVEEA